MRWTEIVARVERDKLLHFAFGATHAALGVAAWRFSPALAGFVGPGPSAALAGLLAGAGREAWNEWRRRRGEEARGFDLRDLGATLAGAAPVVAAVGVAT